MNDEIRRFVVVPAAYVFLLRPTVTGGREVLLQLRSDGAGTRRPRA